MPVNKLFDGQIAVTARALDVRMDRQGLIQSNIANISTPGYQVKDFPFHQVMATVLGKNVALARTDSSHIALDPVQTAEAARFSSEKRPVDLDEEMVKLSENQLMYQVTTRIMAKKLEGLAYAIDEGGK